MGDNLGVIVYSGSWGRRVYWRQVRRNQDGSCDRERSGCCDYLRLMENNSRYPWCIIVEPDSAVNLPVQVYRIQPSSHDTSRPLEGLASPFSSIVIGSPRDNGKAARGRICSTDTREVVTIFSLVCGR